MKLQTASTLKMTLFSTCASGIVLNELSAATACQCGHKLHKRVTPSWINVLICIPCAWPAAVEHNYYIPLWHEKLARVSRCIFLSPPTRNREKYDWLTRLEREPGTYYLLMHQVSLVTSILLRYTKITVNFSLHAERVHCIVLLPVAVLKSQTISLWR